MSTQEVSSPLTRLRHIVSPNSPCSPSTKLNVGRRVTNEEICDAGLIDEKSEDRTSAEVNSVTSAKRIRGQTSGLSAISEVESSPRRPGGKESGKSSLSNPVLPIIPAQVRSPIPAPLWPSAAVCSPKLSNSTNPSSPRFVSTMQSPASPPTTPKMKRDSRMAQDSKKESKGEAERQNEKRAKSSSSGVSVKEQVIGAFVGSTIAEVIVYPLDTIKILQQVRGDGFLQLCSELMETQGLAGFYRGVPGRLFQTVMSNGMFFFLQSVFKNKFKKLKGLSATLLLNMVAQQCNRLLTTPLDIAANIHQTDPNSTGFLNTLIKIGKEEGVKGLWKGLNVALLLSSNPALMFTLVDRITAMWLSIKKRSRKGRGEERPDDKMLSASEMFFVSGLAKMVATFLTYPLIRAKTIMQTKAGASGGLFKTLAGLLNAEGLRGVYTGVWVMSWKTVLFNALMMAIKQKALRMLPRGISDKDSSIVTGSNPQDSSQIGQSSRQYLEVLGDVLPYETSKTVVYIDGGWSYLHPSHQHMLAEAQSYGSVLIVGVHDEETRKTHGDAFAERYDNRLSRIRLVRGVDAILHHAPWHITADMIRELNISKVITGYRAPSIHDDVADPYLVPKQMGIYISLADPYSGMWRNIVRVAFSNVDSTEIHHDPMIDTSAQNTVDYMTYGMFKSHSTGHFTLERQNSFYFYHTSADRTTHPSRSTRRGRDLAMAQSRRDEQFEATANRKNRESRDTAETDNQDFETTVEELSLPKSEEKTKESSEETQSVRTTASSLNTKQK